MSRSVPCLAKFLEITVLARKSVEHNMWINLQLNKVPNKCTIYSCSVMFAALLFTTANYYYFLFFI